MALSKLATTTRDLEILKFLWTFKVASTSIIATRFFENSFCEYAYAKLKALEKGGLIKASRDVNANAWVWTLDQKGFSTIRKDLPPLREEGFKSEHVSHDFLLTAAHLGHWLRELPSGVTMMTEQELRRLDYDYFPYHIPRTEIHVPDGYWIIPNGKEVKVIALEVELSNQRHARYEMVGDFYERYKNIYGVVWLVPNVERANCINQIIAKSTNGKAVYHNFVALKDFRRFCWNAELQLGKAKGKTWNEYLNSSVSNPSRNFDINSILDGRKCPYIPMVCK